jgi:molybdopterin/thiamine biosynthesis adenylyltransferase
MDYLDYRNNTDGHHYRPQFFRLTRNEDVDIFNTLIGNPDLVILDCLQQQLSELIQLRHPGQRLTDEEIKTAIPEVLGTLGFHEYGVWVFYPWSNRLIHILDEAEFKTVRNSRNQLKITPAEQALLAEKKIGIIGLSVGNAIALTMAMEGTAGEFRLADFDTIDLSNLNRIRTGLHNLGQNKAVVCAREIAEIDPFLKVVVYEAGLNDENIADFFEKNGRLDFVADECDGLETKISLRLFARRLGIPVVMETSDRGMLDIERFDLEPDRPLFHGRIQALGENLPIAAEKRMQYLMAIVDVEQVSDRLKLSYAEIGKSLHTWPQLASAVIMGGGTTTDIARRILLNSFQASGRWYMDIDQLLNKPE